ncbi:MAG TPA: hypothetical protein VJ246_00400 [Patescibacteria group bacterium]|nr:hypothetical protein [Patescibacteria group bacterium]
MNKQNERKLRAIIRKLADESYKKETNDQFWDKLMEFEQLAEIDVNEDQRFELVLRNPRTNEEKRYEGIRLRKMLDNVRH